MIDTSTREYHIARLAHEINAAACRYIGDPWTPWHETNDELKESVIQGVRFVLEGATPEQLHQSWMNFKFDHGWVWGAVKDPEMKTHPNLVPYAELPEAQKLKDQLFSAAVEAAHELWRAGRNEGIKSVAVCLA